MGRVDVIETASMYLARLAGGASAASLQAWDGRRGVPVDCSSVRERVEWPPRIALGRTRRVAPRPGGCVPVAGSHSPLRSSRRASRGAAGRPGTPATVWVEAQALPNKISVESLELAHVGAWPTVPRDRLQRCVGDGFLHGLGPLAKRPPET